MEGCVLITGASGLLGRQILKTFLKNPQQWKNVLGTAFSRSGENLVKLDLTDLDSTRIFIEKTRPEFLIHAAAQRFPDKMDKDPEASIRLNVDATRTLAEAMKSVNGRIVYISTDYVFDGKNPPYSHQDEPNPLNFYGKSKLDGEKVVLETDPNNLVLRIPILYGDVGYLDESAITTLFMLLLNPPTSEVSVSDYEIRRPSSTTDIAEIIYRLVTICKEKGETDAVSGVYQWCGHEPMTKFGMVQTMSEIFKLDASNLKPDKSPSPGAPRPYDTTMQTDRLTELGIDVHTTFKDGIKACLEKWAPQ